MTEDEYNYAINRERFKGQCFVADLLEDWGEEQFGNRRLWLDLRAAEDYKTALKVAARFKKNLKVLGEALNKFGKAIQGAQVQVNFVEVND